MVFAGGVLFLVELVLLVYCVANIVTTPEDQVRNLPKLVWLLVVVVLPLAGGIAWLVGGRPQDPTRTGLPFGGGTAVRPARPARQPALSPDDDEAFLRGLRERAEAQRREAQRREAAQRRETQQHPQDGEHPEEPGPAR